MEGERWYGADQEWDGFRIPGPRAQRDGFEADPLTAAFPYGVDDAGNPLAAASREQAGPREQVGPREQAAPRESARPPLEEPTGPVPPVPSRPDETMAFPASGSGYALELGLTVAGAPTGPSAAGGPPVPGPAMQSSSVTVPIAPPVSPPVPPVAPPQPEPQRFHAEPIDRASPRRPSAPIAPVGDGVYRTRRPAVALTLVALTVIFEVPALRLFLDAAIGGPVSAAGLVSGMFLVIGLPLLALGLYALVTGATRLGPDAGGGVHVWLRPPAAYLPIALILLLAAALAAGP